MSQPNTSGTATSHSSGFLARPSSASGRVAVALFLVAIVLVALNASVIESLSLNGTLPSGFTAAFNIFVALWVLAAGISGLLAIVFKRERSWAVFVATVVPLIVLSFEIFEILQLLL